METRANYTAVGIFTLIALAITLGLVYWFGRYGDNENLVPLDVRIQGSVSGLGPGSVVQFNGITVGRVDGLSLDSSDPRFVIVHTRVNSATPIREDSRANIGIRGLSGGAFIQLEGGSPDAKTLLAGPGVVPAAGTPTPQIKGDPAALADLLTRINGIASRIEGTMQTVESFVTTNEGTVVRTLNNVEVFSKSLSENSSGIGKFLASAGDVAISLEQLSGKLDSSLKRAEEILAAVDPKRVQNTVENIEAFTQSIADQREDLKKVVAAVNDTVAQLNGFSDGLNKTLAKVDGVVDAVEPAKIRNVLANLDDSSRRAKEVLAALDEAKINTVVEDLAATTKGARAIVEGIDKNSVQTLLSDLTAASKNVSALVAAVDAARINKAVDNISGAAEGAQTIIADVRKVTEPLGARAGDVDRIVSDASQLVARLNESSKKIDGVLDNVNAFVGSDATKGIASDIQRTLAEFRRAARVLTSRVSEVSNNVSSFTKRGLGDTQTLIRDARQSINRIDRVIRNIQDNPSSLISGAGGSRVRESSGRPRR